MTAFTLNPELDAAELAHCFVTHGYVQLRPFLAPHDAAALHQHLRSREDWRLVLNSGDKVFELDRAAQAALSPEKAQALDQAVIASARNSFQYRYETIRVPDTREDRQADASPLARFADLMNAANVLDLLRHVTGAHDVGFADAQATAYGPGHFLTRHTDDVAGKNRRAAYVYNLSPNWQVDWGGVLLFHESNGQPLQGFAPAINVLNLFRVPRDHSVSLVAPWAAYRRYSITGWLRTGSPPGPKETRP